MKTQKSLAHFADQKINHLQKIKGGRNGSGTRKAASSAQTQPKLL